MIFAKVENGSIVKYPYTLSMFKADYPKVSPPNNMQALTNWGVVVVAEVAQPAPSDPMAFKVVEATPTNIGGTWTQTWTEVALTQAEIDARQEAAEDAALLASAKADNFIQQFVQYDAAQVQNYIENNVTDFASAKAVIKKLALICLVLSKRTLG